MTDTARSRQALAIHWGRRVAEARRAADHTQRSLSIALDCAQSTIAQIEQGHRIPSDDLRQAIARVLEQDPNDLFRYPEPERAA